MPIHPKQKLLSNSTITGFHTCPRKSQLTKLYPLAEREQSVHLSFGSFFGAGLQALLAGTSLKNAVVDNLHFWDMEPDEAIAGKSLWTAIAALEQFSVTKHLGALADYEVAVFNGKPALELSFCITLPNGFYYRGYVDCVLRHKHSGQYLVVDIKTTGQNSSNPAKYQNSPQCLGYSIIMDKVAPGLNSYEVMYFEYMTYTRKFVDHLFVLSNLSRAQWLRNLLLDIDIMQLYSQYDDWPMHGESCASYGKACQFIDCCTMSTASLIPGAADPKQLAMDAREFDTRKELDEKGMMVKQQLQYDIEVTFTELLTAQLGKV